MTRYTIEGSPISVAYGKDDFTGVFISVFDDRLRWKEEASNEVNEVANNIGVKDGGGSYFNLHTGDIGFGTKVSEATMKVYMTRYGVPKKRINAMFSQNNATSIPFKSLVDNMASFKIEDTPSTDVKECHVCNKSTKTSCSKCALVYYCSKACETKDLQIHKFICNSLSFPEKKLSSSSVYGILLPEKGDKPILVEIALNVMENKCYRSPQLEEFFGKDTLDHRYMLKNPNKSQKIFQNGLIFEFRDRFLEDGSKINRVIKKFTDDKNPIDWKGPIVIMKFKGNDLRNYLSYIDIELKDFSDIIDFFLCYGSS